MNKYIQFLYGILFSGRMHENPVRFLCTHPWLEYALWGRCLHDLSWWVSSTQKHWVWGSPCNSSSAFTAANAALDNKPIIHWSSLLFVYFINFFLLHSILHQSASVIHLKFFIPRSVRPLGLKLYIALFLTLFFFVCCWFWFFPQPNRKLFFRVKSCLPLVLLLSNLPQTEEWTWWINGKMCLFETLRKKAVPRYHFIT